MKFKKRLLSEEVGLPKTNKQNYTKGKKQRVVLNEGQLQRLIKLINEKDKKQLLKDLGKLNFTLESLKTA